MTVNFKQLHRSRGKYSTYSVSEIARAPIKALIVIRSIQCHMPTEIQPQHSRE